MDACVFALIFGEVDEPEETETDEGRNPVWLCVCVCCVVFCGIGVLCENQVIVVVFVWLCCGLGVCCVLCVFVLCVFCVCGVW